jgi:hypothetical protein
MDWNKGFSARFYVSEVDPKTWKDIDRIEITGGSTSSTDDGLRNAADIDCTDFDRSREMYVRIWMDARQEGELPEHVALFTGLASAPDREMDGTRRDDKIQLCSVLQPCQDVLLPRGWYAPAGTLASVLFRDLLSVTSAPVEIQGETPALSDHIVAEDGENHLTMVEKLLTAIGWRMSIKGDGTILIRPMPTDAEVIFDPLTNDCIETKIKDSYDWKNAPNVFRASTATRSVTAMDTDETSMLSVPRRKRQIWMEESDCKLNDGESLESYAERRLKEEQAVRRKLSYTRRFRPDLLVSDVVDLRYPAQDIYGYFAITSQNITLGYGAPVSEEVTAWTK